MMTFEQAEQLFATARNPYNGKRLRGNSTVLVQVNLNTYAVRYHRTNVVEIHRDGTYTLRTGGYHTNTTKGRINEYSPARVYQEKFEWYIMPGTNPRLADGEAPQHAPEFYDGVRVNHLGDIVEAA